VRKNRAFLQPGELGKFAGSTWSWGRKGKQRETVSQIKITDPGASRLRLAGGNFPLNPLGRAFSEREKETKKEEEVS